MNDTNITVLESVLSALGLKLLGLGGRVLVCIFVFAAGSQIIKLVRKLMKKGMERAGTDTGVMQFLDSFVKAALYVILAFLVAANFGIDAASIVALLGSAGVAIGLAVQGSLSNLAGGVLILLLKPFKVGDYIVACAAEQEGTVAEIQIFYTRLTTFDNKTVILPNGSLANNSIVNVTAGGCRRLDIPVGIAYDSDIRKAKEALLAMLQNDPKVMKEQDMRVVVNELGESSINLSIRCWFAGEDYWDGKYRLTEQAKYVLDEAGVQIPFPQVDVHLDR